MPILSVCCPQGRRSCKYRDFTQKKEFYASVRSWGKKGYHKQSEPKSVHFCEVYQSHIRWRGYRKTDPEQQKTVPTPKGYKNLTFTPGLLKLFMVYGGSEGNRTPVRKHFHGTFSERSFCIEVSPFCAPRSRLTDQLSRYSLTLPGDSRKVSCMFDAGSGACR